MDSQVKLKGYRIELDEVANAMMLHPDVISACVVVKDKSHLVGFFTPADVCKTSLENFALGLLPAYMTPTIWIGLDVMPMNSNGKINRSALEIANIETVLLQYETDIERLLASVWSDVLSVDDKEIGRNTSFISLGGDSISAIRVSAKMKHLGWTLSTANVVKFPRLEAMARAAAALVVTHRPSNVVVSGDVPLTPIQHMSFCHPWRNAHHWNLSMTLKAREAVCVESLKVAVAKLVDHHDMLRARFDHDGVRWKQHILVKDSAPNVKAVQIGHVDDLTEAILIQEQSLNLTTGPVFAVTLLGTPFGDQFVQFTLHHAIADMVSWRILANDLETVLSNESLATKSTSFQDWSEAMTKQAPLWLPAAWTDYMGMDVAPPATACADAVLHRGQAVLQTQIATKLSAANSVYGTNIQEMALAALTGALAQMRQVDSTQLLLMMEGHGREPWNASLDVSSTVGWFTCEYPVVFTATSSLSNLLRDVKQTLRAVPDKGLSYEAIKYLVPPSPENTAIQNHRRHNLAFNYLGRFQEMQAKDGLFEVYNGLNIPQTDPLETNFTPGSISLHHHEDSLVLTMDVPDWLFRCDQVGMWCDLWCVWMEKLVAHCLDPATIGGRTLSDVPLLKTSTAVQAAERTILSTLHLRPLDVVDMYPVTSLQAGLLTAMIQDPSEYVLQTVLRIDRVCEFGRLRSSWRDLVATTPFLSTVFGSTVHGLFQTIPKDDWTTWTVHDRVLSKSEWSAFLASYMRQDRLDGFSLASKSFHRFYCAALDDGSLRVVWTTHHAVMDGWSLPLVMDKWHALLNGRAPGPPSKPFRDHVEWLDQQDMELCQTFWQAALANADKTQLLALPKPDATVSELKYRDIQRSIDLVHLRQLCKTQSVTPSTVFRAAWAILLHVYTRSEFVMFGAVMSGRDNGEPDVESMIGMLINTVPVLTQVSPRTTVAEFLSTMQTYSTDVVSHAHASLMDIKRWTAIHRILFDTVVAFENYPQAALDPSKVNSASIAIESKHEYADTTLGIAISPLSEDKFHLFMTYNSSQSRRSRTRAIPLEL
ncbi:hypothetical protein H310_13904 [Aphanomyces invadans]|uniref:Carrier domain-containing protein n=1 Tax=Aphanomyces invadans TaxID=157072 RepID=A0A024TBU6_9STRA|nr:hypothetical protein H310_13904 [Aphanomyces invadans]ETV91508.1 hypothetical protein H310_13904 [Aphanomyces invadans]|eukprot:XP_008879776.1 hypothetical protein H310_13904 [Aphanomyces invadans]